MLLSATSVMRNLNAEDQEKNLWLNPGRITLWIKQNFYGKAVLKNHVYGL